MNDNNSTSSGTLECLIQELLPLTMETDNPNSNAEQPMEVAEVSTANVSASNSAIEQLTETTETAHARREYKLLNKAQKVRFHALIALGVEPSEAKRLSKKNFADLKKLGYKFPNTSSHAPPKGPVKRHRSEEASPPGHIAKAAKTRAGESVAQQRPSGSGLQRAPVPSQTSSQTTAPLAYSQVTASTRVGITNDPPMTDAQMALLRNNILHKIASLGRGKGPVFQGFSFKPGWALITCENQHAKTWLEETIPTLKPWPEAKLAVVGENDLPRRFIASVYVPGTDTDGVQLTLNLLGAQNEGLNTDLWKILNSKVEKDGISLILSLDDSSVEVLNKLNRKANIGFRKVQFHLRDRSLPTVQTGTLPPPPQPSTSSNPVPPVQTA